MVPGVPTANSKPPMARLKASCTTEESDEAIPVEAQGAEIASEGDGHAGEAPVGHEHVGAAAEHDPRRALGRAHIDQPRERPHGIRAHEKARRASDAVGGVAT